MNNIPQGKRVRDDSAANRHQAKRRRVLDHVADASYKEIGQAHWCDKSQLTNTQAAVEYVLGMVAFATVCEMDMNELMSDEIFDHLGEIGIDPKYLAKKLGVDE